MIRRVTAMMGLAVLGLAASVRANIVNNGSFEVPTVGGNFVTVPNGAIPTGWDVLGAPSGNPTVTSIDQIGNYWQAADGVQSLDMNGLSYGVIGQTLTVIPGQKYFVQFAMSGNPDGGPPVKSLQVDVMNSPSGSLPYVPALGTDGALTTFGGSPSINYENLFTFDTSIGNTRFPTTSNPLGMDWELHGFTFVVPNATTSVYLQFTSRTVDPAGGYSSSPWGPALDAVSVAVPLHASAGVGFGMLAGFGALFGVRKGLSRRRRIA